MVLSDAIISNARFNHPRGVVVAVNGDIFVADSSIYDQRKIPLHLQVYHWIPKTRNLRKFLVSGIQW